VGWFPAKAIRATSLNSKGSYQERKESCDGGGIVHNILKEKQNKQYLFFKNVRSIVKCAPQTKEGGTSL